MARNYYTVPGGVEVTLAFSLVGATRGQYLLDPDMSPPQPASVTEISTPHGVWRRVLLRQETKAFYSADDRSDTVRAWVRC